MVHKLRKNLLITVFVALYASLSFAAQIRKVVVFDLNGVLISVSRGKIGFTAAMRAGNLFDALVHMRELAGAKGPLFAILNQIGQSHEYPPCDETGAPLPTALVELQAGTMSCADDRELARGNLFGSEFQAKFIRELIGVTFDPQQFVAACEPIKEGVRLLRSLAARDDVAILILSNFEIEQFNLLRQKKSMCSIFNHIPLENCIISGAFQHPYFTKPHPNIFTYLVTVCQTRYPHVRAEDIIFFDDQEENVAAAKNRGICTCHIANKKSYRCAAKMLTEEHGVAVKAK
jgi:FMN phosphatase YigB (HAD superfamily)